MQFAHVKFGFLHVKVSLHVRSRIMLIRLSEISQSYMLKHVAIRTNISLHQNGGVKSKYKGMNSTFEFIRNNNIII